MVFRKRSPQIRKELHKSRKYEKAGADETVHRKTDFVQGQDHDISRAALHAQTLASFSQLQDRETKGKVVKGQWSALEEGREKT